MFLPILLRYAEATLVYPSIESHLHPITHILAILLLSI